MVLRIMLIAFSDLDWSNILSLLNAICIAWAVAATELTLVWNEVSDVYAVSSTGQLIPLIIGIANFAQITYTIVLSHTQVLLTDMLLVRKDKQHD